MTDDDLSPPLADALRRLGAGPAPTPTQELAALFVRGAPARRGRVARLARRGLSVGVAVKVLLGTGVVAAASVGAANVVTRHPVPHHRPPAVVTPASDESRHRTVTDTPGPASRTPGRTPRPVTSATPGDDQDATQPPGDGASPRVDPGDRGAARATTAPPDGGSGG